MKRVGNIWNDTTSIKNGITAVIDGTRYKRGNHEVQRLLFDDKHHMIDPAKARKYAEPICDDLKSGTWKHSEPKHRRQFCRNRASSKGKWRDLYIPTLRDHIVAHMLIQTSLAAFMRGMYPDCCGSVPGRGIKHIVKRVTHWLQDDKECRYFVKLDIRKFFDNIDRDILKAKLRQKIKDKYVLEAFDQIIDSAPVACPVGYYTSPWFANLYLESLDWFIAQQLYKERRGKRISFVRHRIRYIDDILLIGTSKLDLKKAVHAISDYLLENYGLHIKDSWEIKKIGKHELVDGEWKLKPGTYWCDIGGYKFSKDATILRDGIFLHTRRLVRKVYKQGYATDHQNRSLISQIGWASHCDSGNFFENDVRPYVNVKEIRRAISHVDKKREQQTHKAADRGDIRESCDSAEEFQTGPGYRRDSGALGVSGKTVNERTV